MSHYRVAVFSDTEDIGSFAELLRPYSENNEDEYVFEPVTDEELNEAWEKFRENNPGWKHSNWLKNSYHKRDGVYGHWYNPHGYYDYYSFDGGAYMYDLLPEKQQELLKEDADVPENYPKSWYDWKLSGKCSLTDSQLKVKWRHLSSFGDGFYSPAYYLERYGDEETYMRQMRQPEVPYAFVTPDGVWHAPGTVGWFAISTETAESWDKYVAEWIDFIQNGPECYVNLVDCHI